MNTPPDIPAFKGSKERKENQISVLTSAVTKIAKVLAPSTDVGCSTNSSATSAGSGISSAKLAALRSNYLQQMRDLHQLLESRAISETEFIEQKTPILVKLKNGPIG